jgi:signal peptidase I
MTATTPLEKLSTVKSELASEIARNFGYIQLRIAGCSMLPALRPGDIVRVERCDAGAVRIGEIVQIVLDGQLVCHRLIEIKNDRFITQGDANCHVDPEIGAPQILGLVTSVLRKRQVVDARLTRPRRIAADILKRGGLGARILWRLRRRAWQA